MVKDFGIKQGTSAEAILYFQNKNIVKTRWSSRSHRRKNSFCPPRDVSKGWERLTGRTWRPWQWLLSWRTASSDRPQPQQGYEPKQKRYETNLRVCCLVSSQRSVWTRGRKAEGLTGCWIDVRWQRVGRCWNSFWSPASWSGAGGSCCSLWSDPGPRDLHGEAGRWCVWTMWCEEASRAAAGRSGGSWLQRRRVKTLLNFLTITRFKCFFRSTRNTESVPEHVKK